MDSARLRDELCAEARRLGFVGAGATSVAPFDQARRRALDAIQGGRLEGMPWFSAERVRGATDLAAHYTWARSFLALAWPYPPAPAPPHPVPGAPRGRVAAYALMEGPGGQPSDYHRELERACGSLVRWLQERVPSVRAKRIVDHGWAPERAVAERAGLGFCGKNTCLLTVEAGSYVLLAELLLSVDLPANEPSRRNCGSCQACLPACPTGAITAPGVLDSRRCISYLTIEHRGAIPLELRPLMGTWVFGCDLCQEACPVNGRLAPAPRPADAATRSGPVAWPDLVELLELDDAAVQARFGRTALRRTGRSGLARNAAIALGNAGDVAAVPALERARDGDPDPVVREAASWALARLTAGMVT